MKRLKVLTVVGTRPEIIRLACVLQKLDASPAIEHILVHTGQNYDYELNEVFFEDLGLRKPDYFLNAAGTNATSTAGQILINIDPVLEEVNPDAFLVLGDTNSCLCAIAAKKRHIPIFHMEAGNRCFDQRVPEESNRKIVDHISDINLTYSSIAREYLLREGIPADRVIKTGSPMYEVLHNYLPKIEASTILEKLQLERLQKQVKNVYENVPMYRERMDKKGVKPEDIKELKDLAKLPFTTKQDLRDYYPFDLFAADKKDIVRIHASSGTTGRQIVAGYTRNDLDMWADCMARQIAAAGGDENSVVQVSYGYGLFTGGLGAHGGSERIGAMTIPTSSGNTERQIRLMIELGATHLCCTPSYAMYLGETINEMGVKDQLSLKAGIFGAEPWTEDMRHQIEQSLGIKAYDVYGLTEITGPGVSYECSAQNGMHVCEDMFIPEIIDPDTEEVLPPGSFGELVFTTITKEGMPMMRYRTRDLCVLDYEKCECGRTLVRMKKPAGRTDDMLIIRGVNVFPSQIEEVLLKIGGDITPNYQIIVGRENNTDTLEVQVEMSEGMLSDDVKSVAAIEKNIVAKLRSTLGLGAKVTLVEPKTITRSEGKAKRVIDNRKLHD